MQSYKTPGVYAQELAPEPAAELRTGVPALLGYAGQGKVDEAVLLSLWSQFEPSFGTGPEGGMLALAVRGFFENGGELCYVIRLDDGIPHREALEGGLTTLESLDTIDLVCAPELMGLYRQGLLSEVEAVGLQADLLAQCERQGDRFAILDSLPGADLAQVLQQRAALTGTNGALYYPWLRVEAGSSSTEGLGPPCGHVAGVYARSDRQTGVHKAPANEVLEGVLDLEVGLNDGQQDQLNPVGVNCLRAFPGRGIRVWGARTLAGENDTAWRYVNVRRLFLTAVRWMERNMTAVPFEPNDARLWARISRELNAYFLGLYRDGALKGGTPQEAFYVRCDAGTNPPEVREAGMVVSEIGLAPALPYEFVEVRIVHGAGGVTISGPSRPK